MSRANGGIGLPHSKSPRAPKLPNEHYHVLQGLKGLYMPESNDVYRTKRAAKSGACELARMARQDGEKVRGCARDGFDVGDHNEIVVTTCDVADCLKDLDEDAP